MSDPGPELIGYAAPWCVTAGDRLHFMVSIELPGYEARLVRVIHGDETPAGPGFLEEETPSATDGRCGSCIAVSDAPAFSRLQSFAFQACIFPTTPVRSRPQGILAK